MGGGEGCVCPPAGPQYFVDVNGGTATGPTGAHSPVSCRFSTLAAGLAAATAPGSVVTAVGSVSGAPVTFHESGPLVVAPGVTLTSDATPCSATAAPPCNHVYSVVANAPASPFVKLGAGATISELDIEPSSAGANGIETDCGSSAGPVTVVDVKVGNAAKTGVYHSGSCPLSLDSSTITGAGESGVIIDSTSATNAAATLLNNVVTGNRATISHPVSGARFGGGLVVLGDQPLSLVARGNRFTSNQHDQVLVLMTGSLNLSGGTSQAACTATPPTANTIGCYDTANGGVGLSANAAGVDASYDQWQTNPPVACVPPASCGGKDYLGPVTTNGSCAANTTCP